MRASLVAGSPTVPALVLAVACLAVVPQRVFADAHFVSAAGPQGQVDYRVAHWTTVDGLPQSTITDMAFLPSGEIWLATFGGLARFDGYGFNVLDIAADAGLPANRIVSLAVDGTDAFLFLTQQGHLGRVEGGRSTLLVPPPGSPAEILDMLVDHDGRLYSRSTNGRIWYSNGRHAWRSVVAEPKGVGYGQDLAEDEDGKVWAVWGEQLLEITGGRPTSRVPVAEPGVVVATRRGGGLWLGMERGMGRLLDGRVDRVKVQPRLDEKVFAIEPEGEDRLWVATRDEVSRLDRQADGSWWRTSLPFGSSGPLSVRSLHVDGTGNLWIGTAGGGLFRVNPLPVTRFGMESGLRDVGALAPDGSGGAFVASACRQLFHVQASGAVTPLLLPGSGAGDRVAPCGISLAPGPGDSVWARSGSGLYQIRRQTAEARLVTNDLPVDEGPVVANADGSAWVVSRDGSVQLVRPGRRLERRLSLPAPLMSAMPGPDGALWIGGEGLVYRVGRDRVDRFGPEDHVPRGFVRDVLAEPDGTAWIGTYGGGIGRLRAGRVARLTAAEGLPDNSISRILDDGRGRLWISTNRGVAAVEKSDLEAVADGRSRRFAPVVFGEDRGVAEANFGRPAGFVGADGRLWFGTIDGVACIEAAAFPFNPTPPVVRVVEVRADGHVLPLGSTVRVPPLTARLRVTVATHAPLYPEQLRFRYRVEGIDAGWVEAGAERTLDWSPPGPGRHLVLVEARNEDGIWSSAPATVELDVRPTWWQTRTFWTAVFVALALAGALEVRRQIRRVERRHAEELRTFEKQRDAEARTASLRAQLEHVSRAALAGELAASLAHEVRQPIGAIVNNAEAGRRNLEHYLQRPAELEQVLGDIVADGRRASEVVQGLRGFLKPADPNLERVDLSGLVREMLPLVRRELDDNRVGVELALADDLPLVEGLRVQLGQIVVNLVVNACEALAQQDGRREITLTTAERDGRVELVVSDNGPGLDEAVAARVFEPFVTTKPEGLGVGLSICRSIAERHGGHLSAEAAPGGGVRMTLTLPAERPSGGQP